MLQVRLQRINPTGNGRCNSHEDHPDDGCPPRALFTREMVEIIHELDRPMFDEWNYSRRSPPSQSKKKQKQTAAPLRPKLRILGTFSWRSPSHHEGEAALLISHHTAPTYRPLPRLSTR